MISRLLFRLFLVFAVSVLASVSALAQTYPPGGGGTTGTGSTSTGGGYGSSGAAIGIGVGAAAGVALAYLALHKSSVIGCVEPSSDGMKLMNERDKKTYAILAGTEDLKAGERVELRGKRNKDNSGMLDFHVQKLVKDYGPCNPGEGQSSERAKAGMKHE